MRKYVNDSERVAQHLIIGGINALNSASILDPPVTRVVIRVPIADEEHAKSLFRDPSDSDRIRAENNIVTPSIAHTIIGDVTMLRGFSIETHDNAAEMAAVS